MVAVGIIFLVTVFLIMVCRYIYQHLKLFRKLSPIPGPRAWPFLGNAIHFPSDPVASFEGGCGLAVLFSFAKGVFKLWFGPFPVIFVTGPEAAETLLTSNQCLVKAEPLYGLLHPWLGLGLLTSYPQLWRKRRKLLTPTFHYDILKDFVVVFNDKSKIMIKILESHCEEGKPIDCKDYIQRCALDIISETAMGRDIKVQTQTDSLYVKTAMRINDIICKRQKVPWMYSDFIFNYFGEGKEHQACVDILHQFTLEVIRKREEERKESSNDVNQSITDDVTVRKPKKCRAFLDLLLDIKEEGEIDFAGIREEVDTFMFEGHDTTTAGMNWFLVLVGCYPEIQKKLHNEIDAVFGTDKERDITVDDLKNLVYLERTIKEVLRLHPSVAFYGRTPSCDMKLCGYDIPAGTMIIVYPYMAHRNPNVWPDPEIFDPDRFLPENTVDRHPFAFLPFSAGYRNCIGQRFAILEEKTVLSWILRRFHIRSILRHDQIIPRAELIMRPDKGVQLELTKR